MSWPISRLGEVISFIRGVTFTPEDQVEPFSEGSTVVMRTKNVQVAGLDQSDLIAVPSGFVRRKEQALREGDILVSSANSWELVGKASYVPKLAYEATAGGFISIVRAKESRVDSRYLYHWVACPATQHKIRHCGRQTTNISNLDVGRFQDLEIPLPPLPEQKRIAAILDKADAIRRKRQQAIQLADDFLRAVFLDMFGDPVTNPKGWEVRALSNLIDESRGVSYGVVQRGEQVDEGIPLVRISDIATNEFRPEDVVKCSKSISDQYRRTILHGGELLISIRGTVGRVAEVPSMAAGWNISREVAVIPILSGVSSSFLKWLLLSSPIQRSLAGQVKGVAQSGINLADLRNLPVICPPAEIIEKFELAERKIREKYILCAEKINGNELFSSLSQKAFAGLL